MPQPDAFLIIAPERGGQARVSADDYIEGAPELVAQVAASSASIDLGDKLQAYLRKQVREYVVWRVLEHQLDWFVLRDGRFECLLPGPDGILRSTVFPGLWLHPSALLNRDFAQVLAVVQRGIESTEHAAFVDHLRSAQPDLPADRDRTAGVEK
jgi:Putative restriction endonuclease